MSSSPFPAKPIDSTPYHELLHTTLDVFKIDLIDYILTISDKYKAMLKPHTPGIYRNDEHTVPLLDFVANQYVEWNEKMADGPYVVASLASFLRAKYPIFRVDTLPNGKRNFICVHKPTRLDRLYYDDKPKYSQAAIAMAFIEIFDYFEFIAHVMEPELVDTGSEMLVPANFIKPDALAEKAIEVFTPMEIDGREITVRNVEASESAYALLGFADRGNIVLAVEKIDEWVGKYRMNYYTLKLSGTCVTIYRHHDARLLEYHRLAMQHFEEIANDTTPMDAR